MAGTQLIAVHPSIAATIENINPRNAVCVVPLAIRQENADHIQCKQRLLQTIGREGQDIVLVGSVADYEPRTRLKDLIWATDLLSCIRDDVHLMLVGSGWQKAGLLRFLAPTDANVHFVPEQDLESHHLAGLDVFWQSHCIQPLPAAMMLTMSFGVPVISVAGPGLTELVRHQQTGMIVNVGARNEFARWTKFMIENQPLARQLGIQGQQHVLTRYGAGKNWTDYERIYRRGSTIGVG